MKPKVIIDLSIVVEGVTCLDPEKPEELEESIKTLCDLLTDLRDFLGRYT